MQFDQAELPLQIQMSNKLSQQKEDHFYLQNIL